MNSSYDEAWRARLAEAVKRSGRAERDISLSAGLSHGYLGSILKGAQKMPKFETMLKICEAVPVSPIYVMFGLNVQPGDAEFLELVHRNPKARAAIQEIVNALRDA